MRPEPHDLELEFLPTVPEDMRHEVEHLFFFNPRQRILMDKIRTAVDRHGTPEILTNEGRLWIGVPKHDMQCLFAHDRSTLPGRLVGVVLYLRTNTECLSIIHLAVDEEYAHRGERHSTGVGFDLVQKVRQIGRRINGIRKLELPYQPGRFLPV